MRRSFVALIVEDDPVLQRAMKMHLEALGFRVVTAFDHRTALRQLGDQPPDIISIDLGLPDESGYELCERIRRDPAMETVPIVLTSERSFPDDIACAEEAGATAFLKKPFSMRRLTRCVDSLLTGRMSSGPWIRRLRWS
jgi:two-component system phosphate regulon response regulator OmpR